MTVEVFLRDQIRKLSAEYDVTVVANLSQSSGLLQMGCNVSFRDIHIERKVVPWKDFKAFLALLNLLWKEKFDVVHSVTPKAGLLAMSAAFLARIPNRLHTFTGQVWATKQGIARRLLRWMDRLIFRFSTWCYVDSHSQREFLLAERVVTDSASSVLLSGSISGVDIKRFAPSVDARMKIRSGLNIPGDSLVFLFLGRLTEDKGVMDLVRAFDRLASEKKNIVLLVVGPDEAGVQQQVTSSTETAIGRVLFVEYTDRPEDYMNAADVFCLPSYREGFGSVIIEAAAVGIPSIGSRIYGISDAIVDGETGLLHEAGDADDIYLQMMKLGQDREMRVKMGAVAQQRVKKHFTSDLLTAAVVDEYKKILGSA
jgi:glycosyltransferase involved in cell wall biosynthesis